jgi:hypothetical protein
MQPEREKEGERGKEKEGREGETMIALKHQ